MATAADTLKPFPGAIQPAWWTGVSALPSDRYTIDCGGALTAAAASDREGALASRMRALFDETGLVHVTNTGLTDFASMRSTAKFVIDAEMSYEGGANPRDSLEANVYEVGAPLVAWLHYHHEMAYIGQSTRLLAFLCRKAAPDKGHTFFSDNVRATEAILETPLGEKLKKLGLCYHRNLTDREAFRGTDEIGVYNHWQKSLMTEDPDEAEARARARGLVTEWGPDRLLKTRYYVSAFEYFPKLDRNLLFSSIADDGMWFDGWPKVMHLPYDQRPLKLTFGDDSEMSREEKRLFVDVYDRFGIRIDWRIGDVVVFCNYRFAHGRPGIHLDSGEERELGVLIGEAFERVGDLPGKW